jgi:exopolyphosphatase/guanosine-5'-triphosphate,3'-diphosphate pyrophosphatase
MSKSGKYAVVDMGTNSVRLLLCTLEEGVFTHIEKQVNMTRLGKGVNETRLIEIERMNDTIDVVKRYLEMAKRYGAEKFFVMATSAVRDAQNSDILKQKFYNATGVAIDVISGDEEAEIGFAGVLAGEKSGRDKFLVVDIGGGSTELIVGDQDGIVSSVSLDAGAVRMTGAFLESDPVAVREVLETKKAISDIFQDELENIKKHLPLKVIGIGGTAATYATMSIEMEAYNREVLNGLFVSMDAILQMNEQLAKLSVEERKEIKGLESKRADIIYAGGLILEHILAEIDAEGFYFSDFDNLEGYLAKQLK